MSLLYKECLIIMENKEEHIRISDALGMVSPSGNRLRTTLYPMVYRLDDRGKYVGWQDNEDADAIPYMTGKYPMLPVIYAKNIELSKSDGRFSIND